MAELKALGVRVSSYGSGRGGDDGGGRPRRDRIELYTSPMRWHSHREAGSRPRALREARAPRSARAGVNAGHDLNLENLRSSCARCEGAGSVHRARVDLDALELGLGEAVRRYLEAIVEALRTREEAS